MPDTTGLKPADVALVWGLAHDGNSPWHEPPPGWSTEPPVSWDIAHGAWGALPRASPTCPFMTACCCHQFPVCVGSTLQYIHRLSYAIGRVALSFVLHFCLECACLWRMCVEFHCDFPAGTRSAVLGEVPATGATSAPVYGVLIDVPWKASMRKYSGIAFKWTVKAGKDKLWFGDVSGGNLSVRTSFAKLVLSGSGRMLLYFAQHHVQHLYECETHISQ